MPQAISLPQLLALAEAGDAEAQYCLAGALHGQGRPLDARVDFRFSPRRGELLHFHNVDAQGMEDELSLHAGLPVLRGEKWLASKWLRAEAYPPRRFGTQGLEAADD